MSKKKIILDTLAAAGAIAATGGLASIGIPGIIGGGAGGAAAAVGGIDAKIAGFGAAKTGVSLATKLALAGTAATAGANIYGAHTQASATQEASNALSASTAEALAYQKEQDRLERERQTQLDAQKAASDLYERQRLQRRTNLEQNRYGDFTNNIAPYLSTGASANERIAQLFNFPTPAPYVPRATQGPGGGVPFVDPGPDPNIPGQTAPLAPVSTTMPVPSPAGAPVSGPEEMVIMESPDGERQQVRQSLVSHYESLGARRVA